MKLKYNKKFAHLVGDNFRIEDVKFCDAALSVKNIEIEQAPNGGYYFKGKGPTGIADPPINLTSHEAFSNKLFVDDLTDKKLKPLQRFRCGLSIAKELSNNLKEKYRTGFVVDLSYDYEHCYIRFYKNRKEQPWTTEDLEAFKLEALLVIEI